MKGRFITFEGGEGCGKSTHIALLAERLRAAGREVVLTREPGGTGTGEQIRRILKEERADPPVDRCELLLFLAARAQLVRNVILPALERGAWVLSDRFSDSTFAYQGYGRGLDLETLRQINAFATEGLVPDRTLLLVTDPATARARVSSRGALDRIEEAGDGFHARLRAGFAAMAAAEPARFVVIDSSGGADETAAAVWVAVQG